MDNDKLDTLNREQLLKGMKKALAKISDSYNEVTNTADLWEWADNKTQENDCRRFAAGLAIAKQLLTQALKAEISADKSIDLLTGHQRKTEGEKQEQRIAQT